jgi:catechol 2,3-dioxygenase-like lactoylglutathione lyase family enzyme
VIQHVGLECADFDAEVAFWELLGFEEVKPAGALTTRTRWLQRGGTQIHLLLADAPSAAGHVAVVVEDYERVRSALGGEPRTEYWGAPRTQVRSPSGHLVELMAWPPGGS